MNHQPFKDWILSEEKLTADQNQRLQDHINSCEACKATVDAWNEVEATINRLAPVIPAPGFTARWQVRFNEYQMRKQKRQGWMTIGYIAIVVVSLLVFTIAQLWTLLQSPGPYMAAWFSSVIDLLSIYFSLEGFAHPFNMGSPFYILIGMFFLTGIVSFMSVLWLATIRKLSLARRLI